MRKCPKIVLTGGPGGGKTVAGDLFRRELGDRVVVVPEAATMIYQGGFPRGDGEALLKISQHTIFNMQKSLEDTYRILYPDRYQICDRGTLDGLAYWPGPDEEFFRQMNTSFENEISQYDGVIFFETAAVGGLSIEGGNPIRIESIDEAKKIDFELRKVWSKHPNFIHIPHNQSFIEKITHGLSSIRVMLQLLEHNNGHKS